ncbi:MAG: flagellar biosynthesis anti-sigma factor FlgM [Acidobacteria bacterium]|nr:flagellar biosynthesis anti-sigma factor FlgM [Acidobacteriota bacterium]
MKIGDSNLSAITASAAGTSGTAATRAQGSEPTASAASSNTTDAIQLSDFAKQVNDLQPESPARADRVEQLRKAYLSGNYQVDSAKVASRIVDDAIRG